MLARACASRVKWNKAGTSRDDHLLSHALWSSVQRSAFSPAGSELREVWEAGYFNDIDREFHRAFDRHVDELPAAFVHARVGRRALVYACTRSF
jgi:hypothetical protein